MTTAEAKPSGLELLQREIARQHADANASFAANGAMAARIAASILAHGSRLILIGMGASHYANRTAEPAYRALGVDAAAMVASELLASPLPEGRRVAILVSQSGASGEILDLLERPPAGEERFGLTLEAASTLGKALPCLVGAGGPERAFAATRSLLVSLTLHGAVLGALGLKAEEIRNALTAPVQPASDAAFQRLAACRNVIVSGRRELQGIAEAGALFLMELARLPAFGLEGGQFRHGPLEALTPEVGVVLLRAADEWASAARRQVESCIGAGTTPIVFDASGEPAIDGAITIGLPRAAGLGAAIALLPSLQQLFLRLARHHVPDVGVPLRSTKVTGRE
jgi:fructoselysine-6-P-deglycase FrlB-like protein